MFYKKVLTLVLVLAICAAIPAPAEESSAEKILEVLKATVLNKPLTAKKAAEVARKLASLRFKVDRLIHKNELTQGATTQVYKDICKMHEENKEEAKKHLTIKQRIKHLEVLSAKLNGVATGTVDPIYESPAVQRSLKTKVKFEVMLLNTLQEGVKLQRVSEKINEMAKQVNAIVREFHKNKER
jgi:polyhydroxyalkanoate synthesis regulator phasin